MNSCVFFYFGELNLSEILFTHFLCCWGKGIQKLLVQCNFEGHLNNIEIPFKVLKDGKSPRRNDPKLDPKKSIKFHMVFSFSLWEIINTFIFCMLGIYIFTIIVLWSVVATWYITIISKTTINIGTFRVGALSALVLLNR